MSKFRIPNNWFWNFGRAWPGVWWVNPLFWVINICCRVSRSGWVNFGSLIIIDWVRGGVDRTGQILRAPTEFFMFVGNITLEPRLIFLLKNLRKGLLSVLEARKVIGSFGNFFLKFSIFQG